MSDKKKRINFSTGSHYEELVAYSRAVRIGHIVEVAGTTSIDNNEIVGKNNAFEQTVFILNKIDLSLKAVGASLTDVVRTRIFVTNINDWSEVGKAHGIAFKNIMPVTTMVEVSKLVSEDMLVEIEATAILAEE